MYVTQFCDKEFQLLNTLLPKIKFASDNYYLRSLVLRVYLFTYLLIYYCSDTLHGCSVKAHSFSPCDGDRSRTT